MSQYPVEGNSEGLLALPDLQDVHGKKIALFCGIAGRELLQETLKKRGADCHRYEVYQRHCAKHQRHLLQTVLKTCRLTLVICTSEENLLCLQKLAGSYESQLRQILCVIVSQRLADRAREKGWTRVLAMNTAFTNQRLLEQLLKWRKMHVI
ncbi:MAG: uroporphyrinogen-III synthase [Gammaproteobacteria bacterium]|nr:uroporphyrinogen-III synthase [Gammaproteobacteria bacterium]